MDAENQRIKAIHCLDDFILFGAPESQECKIALETMQSLCARLEVLIAHHKIEGPKCRLTFLGIELDSESGTLRLPVGKVITHKKGTALHDWSAPACALSGETRVNIFVTNDQLGKSGKAAPPPHQPQSRLPVRPSVVVMLPAIMERYQHDGRDTSPL